MKKYVISALALGFLWAGGGCNSKKEEKVLTREIRFTKEGELQLKKALNDSVVANLDIELAENDYETRTGLMYRKGMEEDQAMFFVFPGESRKSFYMKNTEFPLDIIFINKDLKVVNIHKNTVPYNDTPLASGAPAQYVLEVNAGLTDTWGLEPGDVVTYDRLQH